MAQENMFVTLWSHYFSAPIVLIPAFHGDTRLSQLKAERER